jgi:hypothetical protein
MLQMVCFMNYKNCIPDRRDEVMINFRHVKPGLCPLSSAKQHQGLAKVVGLIKDKAAFPHSHGIYLANLAAESVTL